MCVRVCVRVFHKGLVRPYKGGCFSCQPGLYLKSLSSSHTESPLPPRQSLSDNTLLQICTNTGVCTHLHGSAILTVCTLICQKLPVIEQQQSQMSKVSVWGRGGGQSQNTNHLDHLEDQTPEMFFQILLTIKLFCCLQLH